MNTKVILVLATVAITVGLYGVTQSKSEIPVLPNKPKIEEKKIKVWTLKRDLQKAERLSRRDINIEYLTREQAASFGIDSDTTLTFEQRLVAIAPIEKGDMLDDTMLTSPGEDEYISTVIEPGYVPFNMTVPVNDVVGGTIKIGDIVDISVMAATKQNLAAENTVSDINHLTMTPLIAQIPVLDMIKKERSSSRLTDEKTTEVTLILQVTNRQLAKLSVAKRIADVMIHKSIGENYVDDLHADSSDVIRVSGQSEPIKQYRFN
ncbi:Flp pilus assembly protein CpaB [Vibrio alfacsensis]|uniref:Flp pilus assembly protein CpaB n=1 Tax=Vibrio alfacsensis TaxID=1074311 RepID=UPI001BEFA002|nr:Flp pilus assembly protein CpaB [Vibrio alfacsensis]BCN22817.1 Flp pilus assembly protein CpaB [Vibrio alfacsensis]